MVRCIYFPLCSGRYDVVCRRALGAGQSSGPSTAPGACFRLLQYEFLVVKCTKGDFEGLELFVDPYFREQFQIPHPTEHYAKLLESVPVVYVGSRVHLIAIVELLCAEVSMDGGLFKGNKQLKHSDKCLLAYGYVHS